MKKQGELTHKEAVIKALEMLGGKARLKQIYPIAIKLIGSNSKSKNIQATIRRELNSNPLFFKSTPDCKGSWELLSYQEELAKKDQIIADLQAQLLAKDNELKSVKTEDGFISRLIEKLKTIWKDDKKTIGEIRKLLDALGRSDVVAELDACLEHTKKPSRKTPSKIVVNGDFVNTKNVENEVGHTTNYQPQIGTQHVGFPLPQVGTQDEKILE